MKRKENRKNKKRQMKTDKKKTRAENPTKENPVIGNVLMIIKFYIDSIWGYRLDV